MMPLQLQSATSQTIQTHGDSASALSPTALKYQPWNHQIFRKLNAGSTSNGAPVSPSIVVIVIVLSILLILSAFLHLVIRWLARHPRRDPNRSIASLTALEGQLQQLFHIHDSGLEQAFIDALPIFLYNTITGLKEGADCAICLCEFEGDDRLRLLPSCSHAFHMECIDTWLLSHSTCPLCRQALHPECWELPPYSGQGLLLSSSRSSVLGENERRINVSQSEASQVQERNVCSELAATRLQNDHLQMGISAIESQLHNERYIEPALEEDNTKSASAYRGIDMKEFEQSSMHESGRKVSVQLGRCRVIDQHGSRGINSSRRSYSKGSYEYVMDSSKLEVVIVATTTDGTSSRWLNRCHGHRATQSLADLETARRNIADIQASPASENLLGSCWASASFRRLRSVDMKENEGKSCVGSVLQCHWEANDLISTMIDVDTGVQENTLSIRETDQKQASDLINDSQAIDFMNHQTINLPTEPSKRAVSFRIPSRLKAHSNRRALSETEVIIDNWVSDQLIAQQSLDPGPSSAISSSSLAQKTFQWLMGRPQNRTSVPPFNPHHIVDFPLI